MLAPTMRNWFGRTGSAQAPPLASAPLAQTLLAAAPPMEAEYDALPTAQLSWNRDRLDVVDALWGEGFQFPGGEHETLRLAKPLGLSAASSLLLLGAGAGGPACVIAAKLGVWVSGFESDPALIDAAQGRIARSKLGRRAQVDAWTPAEPDLARHFYHHAMALEPLRGNAPEPTLSAIAAAIKPGGQLTMVEAVADTPLDLADPDVIRWGILEGRDPAALPTEVAITRVLGRLGFDVRIAEDISRRHMDQALLGWRTQVRELEEVRPSRRHASVIVREAELWLVRTRLMRTGRLRLLRWHAIGRGSA